MRTTASTPTTLTEDPTWQPKSDAFLTLSKPAEQNGNGPATLKTVCRDGRQQDCSQPRNEN